jgi:hypothetical protein
VETLEARLARTEGKLVGVEVSYGDLREAVGRFEARVDRRFESVDRRFDAIERKIDRIDDRMSRQFMWLVGLQMTTLIAVVGALTAALATR